MRLIFFAFLCFFGLHASADLLGLFNCYSGRPFVADGKGGIKVVAEGFGKGFEKKPEGIATNFSNDESALQWSPNYFLQIQKLNTPNPTGIIAHQDGNSSFMDLTSCSRKSTKGKFYGATEELSCQTVTAQLCSQFLKRFGSFKGAQNAAALCQDLNAVAQDIRSAQDTEAWKNLTKSNANIIRNKINASRKDVKGSLVSETEADVIPPFNADQLTAHAKSLSDIFHYASICEQVIQHFPTLTIASVNPRPSTRTPGNR